MVKNLIKEFIIILLLLAAIILALGVLFYDYIPSSKIIPVVLEYQTPNNIAEELSENISNATEEVIITYEVDSKDLNIYEKTNDYDAGNPNPFSYYTVETDAENNTNTTETNITNNTNTTEDGTFFQNNGTK